MTMPAIAPPDSELSGESDEPATAPKAEEEDEKVSGRPSEVELLDSGMLDVWPSTTAGREEEETVEVCSEVVLGEAVVDVEEEGDTAVCAVEEVEAAAAEDDEALDAWPATWPLLLLLPLSLLGGSAVWPIDELAMLLLLLLPALVVACTPLLLLLLVPLALTESLAPLLLLLKLALVPVAVLLVAALVATGVLVPVVPLLLVVVVAVVVLLLAAV